MPMKQTILGVLLEEPDGTHVQHDVRIMQGDRLRAELEAPNHGLVDLANQGMHVMTLWAWAGLCRTHVIDEDFATFRDRCVEIEPDPGEPDPDAEVPPTTPEGSTSSSSSPTTGPASTGSTPNAASPESTESD